MDSHVSEWPAVVVCESDTSTLESICDRLTADRFNALPAPSAADALRFCRYNEPHLMLLDMTLGDSTGLEVLREIRQADGIAARFDPRLPIIALGGRVDDVERARVLEEGADDFLSKPASYEELRARIIAVLRRSEGRGESPVRVGDLVIDPARRTVHVDGREVHVTKKEFTLLRMLATDPTRVFSKDELLAAIWKLKRSPGATRTVDSHSSRLRRKLDPDHRRYVVNCWGIGYSLVSVDSPAVVS